MTSALSVRRLDVGDDADLAAAYAVECAATRSVRPGWVPLGEAARVAAWRADDGWDRQLLAASEGTQLVGVAIASTARDEPQTCWVEVCIDPRARRRGVGARLVRAVHEGAGPSATRFVAGAYRPTPADMQRLVDGFAHPLGYSVATRETVVELDLGKATLSPPARHPAYAISTHVDGVPTPLRAGVGVLKGLVDAEAPNGELGWQPSSVTVPEYEAEIRLWQEQGRSAIESVAVDGHGTVVAWTCLLVAADPARPAQVEGTLVLEQHRGRRLGRAVKVASLLAARDHGRAARVRTSSDDANVWMRRINADLGFRPIELEVIFHRAR